MYIKQDNSYTLSRSEKEKEYNFMLSVTGEQIEDIVITALETGIYYWAVLNNTTTDWANKPDRMPVSQYAVQLLLEGKTLEFSDIENGSVTMLTLKDLLHGVRLTAVNESWDFDFDDFDSNTADCIFQYAMFGEIIYS